MIFLGFLMVARPGIEPGTQGFSDVDFIRKSLYLQQILASDAHYICGFEAMRVDTIPAKFPHATRSQAKFFKALSYSTGSNNPCKSCSVNFNLLAVLSENKPSINACFSCCISSIFSSTVPFATIL